MLESALLTKGLLARAKELVRPYYLRWLYFQLHPERRPSYFNAAWQYPSSSFEAGQPPSFLVLPMTDWHTRLQRTQHLVRALAARGHASLYVNPHLGREFPRPYGFGPSHSVSLLERRVHEMHVHLRSEPVFHHRMLRPGEVRTIVDAVDRELPAGREVVQMVSLPIWHPVAEELRRRRGFPIVYDCHDVLAGFPNVAREIVEAERPAMGASDVVLYSSRRLQEAHADIPGLLLRNAVEEAWIARAENASPEYVDYIGALDRWFDVDALAHAARHLPECAFRLIGRMEDERIRRKLASFRNIQLVGEAPHAELHRFLRQTRVGLIPFIRNELTLGANPIKLYEYFSYGLPVVASRLPEVEEYGGLVTLYDTPAEFTDGLRRALAEDTSLRDARRTVARKETWGARVSALLNAVAALPRA